MKHQLISVKLLQVLALSTLPLMLCGCGGGGGGGSLGSDTSNRATGASIVQRSVKLNNYNNWFYSASKPGDESRKLDILAQRDNICFVEGGSWAGITPQAIKAKNPAAKVYRIYDLCVKNDWDSDWNNPNDTSRAHTPLTKADIDANDWWLRDGNGRIVKEGTSTWYLDVGKPNFKEKFLENMLKGLQGKRYDGVVFDYWIHDISQDYAGNWLSIDPMPDSYATGDDWFNKAWKPFIEYVTAGLHRAGYGIIGNCAGEYMSGNRYKSWQRTQVDGTIYEQWSVGWEGEWLSGSVVEHRINALSTDPLEVWTADLGVKRSDVEYDRKQMMSLGMYYTGIPSSQANRSYHHSKDIKVFWEPLWDLDIGVPSGSAVKQSGKYFWSRKYSKGLVLLNYEESGSISYTLDQSYKDSSGKVYSGTVTLPAHTAMILAVE